VRQLFRLAAKQVLNLLGGLAGDDGRHQSDIVERGRQAATNSIGQSRRMLSNPAFGWTFLSVIVWVRKAMEDQRETPLDLVRSYVAEGEARCALLADMLEAMGDQSSPQAAQAADRLLAVLDRSLMILREHLKQEQALSLPDATA
jgi:hypothetical protein